MKARAIVPALGSLTSLLLGVAIPVAFPQLDPWFGWMGIGIAGALLIAAIAISCWPQRSNERQRQLFIELADALARLQDIALGFPIGGSWSKSLIERRWADWSEAHESARRLIGEICYDEATSETANDFRQICAFIVDDASKGKEASEHRSEIHALKAPLFRSLHEGKSANRRKMPLPDWLRRQDKDEPKNPRPEAQTRGIGSTKERAVKASGGWIALDEALRYLVEKSDWAYSIRLGAPDVPEDILCSEFFDAAARGEIVIRGYRKESYYSHSLAAASEPIPKKFWIYAGMQPFFEIYHASTGARKDPSRPAVWQRRDKYADARAGFYGRVTVKASDLHARWPEAREEHAHMRNDLKAALERYIVDCGDPDSDVEFDTSYEMQAGRF